MITKNQAATAVARLAALRYFPGGAPAQAEIAAMLFRMVDRTDQLEWLVITAIDHLPEWKGPKELRGIYCSRFPPLDGVDAWSETPGFTPQDSESLYLIEHSRYKELEDDHRERGRSELKRITQ